MNVKGGKDDDKNNNCKMRIEIFVCSYDFSLTRIIRNIFNSFAFFYLKISKYFHFLSMQVVFIYDISKLKANTV